MKKLLTILLFFIMKNTFATNYYIDNSGSDANAGTSPGTAWQTLSKVNSSTFSAGDSILFDRNGTWYGTIRPAQSGTSGSPIVYGAYGAGNSVTVFKGANTLFTHAPATGIYIIEIGGITDKIFIQ